MPRGHPRIGQQYQTANSRLSSAAEELLNTPQPEVLGTIPETTLTHPGSSFSGWTESDGTEIQIEEAPPPWETNPKWAKKSTDARRFVKAPSNVELRWINPRMIDTFGWRDWQAVPARGDDRFRLLVQQMGFVDNTVRRGGQGGDILAWMLKSWVESRQRVKAETVYRRTHGAIERQRAAKEAVERGDYDRGRRYTRVDAAVHPTHTIGEGRTMGD